MSCDVGKATEGLENDLWRRWSDGRVGEWAELIVIVKAELILQPFRHFTYVTANSPTLPSLYLSHSSFSNSSVALPTLQLILQPFRRFTYVTAHSPTLPSLHLRHSSFSNSSVALPTSQLILQVFFRFSYVTGSSLTSLREPPMPGKGFIQPREENWVANFIWEVAKSGYCTKDGKNISR